MRGHITEPEADGGLDLREVPEPRPAPSDVVVEVRAYAMNRGEMNLLQQRPQGWQPGQDVGGVISQAAADGSGPALTEAIRHLAPGGTIAAYGRASGERTEMAFGDFREAPGGKLSGFFVYGTDVSTFGRDLGFLANLVASGQLAAPIGAHHDWT